MQQRYIYPAVFHPEEEGGYSVSIPDLDGCYTCGDDLDEALYMAWDACAGWLDLAIKNGEEIPKPSKITSLKLDGDDFASYTTVDLGEWRRKVNSAVVRRTVSLPAWLNELAQERKVNCSKVLQEALVEYLHV